MTKSKIDKKLEDLKAAASILAVEFRELACDMHDYFDDKNEGWQTGEKGDEYQEWINSVEEKVDMLDEIADFSFD